jgi:hypothetical protein
MGRSSRSSGSRSSSCVAPRPKQNVPRPPQVVETKTVVKEVHHSEPSRPPPPSGFGSFLVGTATGLAMSSLTNHNQNSTAVLDSNNECNSLFQAYNRCLSDKTNNCSSIQDLLEMKKCLSKKIDE